MAALPIIVLPMKNFVTFFLLLALFNLPMAGMLHAGEVKKKPLQLKEMVELAREQDKDYEETRKTEAGIANGYGILTLALAAAVGYVVYQQVNDD